MHPRLPIARHRWPKAPLEVVGPGEVREHR